MYYKLLSTSGLSREMEKPFFAFHLQGYSLTCIAKSSFSCSFYPQRGKILLMNDRILIIIALKHTMVNKKFAIANQYQGMTNYATPNLDSMGIKKNMSSLRTVRFRFKGKFRFNKTFLTAKKTLNLRATRATMQTPFRRNQIERRKNDEF